MKCRREAGILTISGLRFSLTMPSILVSSPNILLLDCHALSCLVVQCLLRFFSSFHSWQHTNDEEYMQVFFVLSSLSPILSVQFYALVFLDRRDRKMRVSKEILHWVQRVLREYQEHLSQKTSGRKCRIKVGYHERLVSKDTTVAVVVHCLWLWNQWCRSSLILVYHSCCASCNSHALFMSLLHPPLLCSWIAALFYVQRLLWFFDFFPHKKTAVSFAPLHLHLTRETIWSHSYLQLFLSHRWETSRWIESWRPTLDKRHFRSHEWHAVSQLEPLESFVRTASRTPSIAFQCLASFESTVESIPSTSFSSRSVLLELSQLSWSSRTTSSKLCTSSGRTDAPSSSWSSCVTSKFLVSSCSHFQFHFSDSLFSDNFFLECNSFQYFVTTDDDYYLFKSTHDCRFTRAGRCITQ